MNDTPQTPQITGEKSLIEHLLTSANDSARHFRTVYTTYLTVMFYAIAVALSIDQELIFRGGSQQLPLVNFSVPIVVFFTVIPWFLLALHFYLLIQATFLSDKVRLYVSELEKSPWRKEFGKARKLLFPLPLAHIISEKESQSKATWILSLIVFISLIVYPLVVLIGIQIRFLPYQSEWITWAHRIFIVIDVLLLWYFWLWIFFPKNENSGKEKMWKRLNVSLLFTDSLTFIVLFIVVFADFPSDRPYYPLITSNFHKWMNVEWIKRIELDGYTLVKKELSPEILTAHYMREENIHENLITWGSRLWCKYAEPLDLQRRNFREAQLSRVTLCNANLFSANLSEAELFEADLSEAELRYADLSNTNLFSANLSNADIRNADLSEAILSNADLSEAILSNADLSEAELRYADLRYADLPEAELRDANLFSANLSEADISGANLSGTIFSDAILTDTNIEYFWVWEDNFPIDIPKSWVQLGYVCPMYIDELMFTNILDFVGEDRKKIIEKYCWPYKSQEDP